MDTLWLALRSDLRRKRRVLVSLALLLGLAGGVVLTAAAGARRTDTAYPRLLTWAGASQVNVQLAGISPRFLAAARGLPQVAAMWSAIQYNLALPVPHGLPDLQLEAFSSPDDSLGVSVDRVKILQGRMFSPASPYEAVIDPSLARMEHLQAGGTLHMIGIPYSDSGKGNLDLQEAYPVSVLVTAVALFDDQVVPATTTNSEPRVLLSPAFSRARPQFSRDDVPGEIVYLPSAGLRLRPGVNRAGVERVLHALGDRYQPPGGGVPAVVDLSDETAATERSIRPQAVALAVFATLAGLISLAIIGQLLARQLTTDATDAPVLRALGMSRGSLFALSLARLAMVTAAGALSAVVIAIAASPLMPIGPARLAEPDPGVEVNLAVLGVGAATITLLPLLALLPAAWRSARRAGIPPGAAERRAAARSPRLTALVPTGWVASGVGVRMAFEPGRGRTAVPVRSAIAGSAVAVAAVLAASVFGASLIGLVSTPHRYGQNWDQELSLSFASVPPALGARLLSTEHAITGYAAGDSGQVTINGQPVAAVGIDPVRGDGYLTILAGRLPFGPGDIVLGTQTMRDLHLRLGQTVQVTVDATHGETHSGVQHSMRVTGAAVFPEFGLPGLGDTDLGNGALMSASLLTTPQSNTGCNGHMTCYNFFLLRYRPGTDLSAAAAAILQSATRVGCPFGVCTTIIDQRPGDIRNYAGIRDTPIALGAVLVLLAVGTLAHVLLTGVRRRRRDLAVLKTLGFTRPQVQGVVAWQATALAAAALLIGGPAGVIAGRWTWSLFANAIGVGATADVPVILVLAAVPVTLLLANVIAAWPGWTAGRLRPATVLRTE